MPLGSPGGFFAAAGVVVVAVILHELIHFVLMPPGGRIFGLWPSRALAYVHRPGDLEDLGHKRALTVLLGPFVVISVLPLAVAAAGVPVNEWLVWVSIWNAFASAFDLQFAGAILLRSRPR